jgi:hypothetical protein
LAQKVPPLLHYTLTGWPLKIQQGCGLPVCKHLLALASIIGVTETNRLIKARVGLDFGEHPEVRQVEVGQVALAAKLEALRLVTVLDLERVKENSPPCLKA